MNYQYLDTPEKLAHFCSLLSGSEWITVDTEFLRNDTYSARLCLVQLANLEHVGVIDTVALEVEGVPQLEPLFELFFDQSMVKVFHAADQDFQIIEMLTGKVPSPVFDTQVAASVCGFSHQVGYGTLIKDLLDIDLDKGHSRTDWARRPLAQDELDYAVADVTWLRDAYLALREQMNKEGRSDWLEQEFAAIENPAKYRVEPEDAWGKVKGLGRIRPKEMGIVRELATWRELRAIERNKPRNWIIKDELIRDLAKRKPTLIGELKRMQGINDGLVRHSGEEIVACVNRGIENPMETIEEKRPKPLSPSEEGMVDLLFAVLRMRSVEQNLSPETVGSKKQIASLARGKLDLPILAGWRLKAVGQELLDIIDGKLVVIISEGALTISPSI
ncbi:MAG: ribonuclease D [Gammaproteobacteria bacterium]|jgi:ribonuclease D